MAIRRTKGYLSGYIIAVLGESYHIHCNFSDSDKILSDRLLIFSYTIVLVLLLQSEPVAK